MCTHLGPENKNMNGILILQGRGKEEKASGIVSILVEMGQVTPQSLRGKGIEANWPGHQDAFCTKSPTSS